MLCARAKKADRERVLKVSSYFSAQHIGIYVFLSKVDNGKAFR